MPVRITLSLVPEVVVSEATIGMLNPCITAADPVKLTTSAPLVLKYRVVVHDGVVSKEQMEKLSKDALHGN